MFCFKLFFFLNTYNHTRTYVYTHTHTHTENITVYFTLKSITKTRYVLHDLVLGRMGLQVRVGGDWRKRRQ